MKTTTYWVVREIKTKNIVGPRGVSTAPHLYRSHGLASAAMKRHWWMNEYEVVAVELEVPA